MTYTQIILAAAKAAKVSGELLLAICNQETNLTNIVVYHDGSSPSYGICQVKYSTASMLGYKGKPDGLVNSFENAKWAASYLKYQEERYDGDWVKMTASYNSGSYNPSRKVLGCPRNLRYLRAVQKKLPLEFQDKLNCGGKN